MKTLIIDELSPHFRKLLKSKNWEKYFMSEDSPPEEIEIVIVKTFTRVDELFLRSYPNLKMVIRAGTGYDNINLTAAKSRNVTICNTPEANVLPAFEHTMSFIYALIKHHQPGKDNIINRFWKEDLPFNWEIAELRLLVVGVGRIGRRVAALMQHLGAEVRGVDPYLSPSEWQERQITETTWPEGLKWCNMITFHCPLTMETHDYFSPESLNILKQPVWLVNTARGGIINEETLLQGLEEGKILGAGLDVFLNEPEPDLALADFPGVYLTPHTGSFTAKSKLRLAEEVAEVWESFVMHKTVINEVKEQS